MSSQTVPSHRFICFSLLCVAASVLLMLASQLVTAAASVPASPLLPNAGPDLIIASIEYGPCGPDIGQTVYITVTIKNQGDAPTDEGFGTYLYIDPATEPPDASTRDTSNTGMDELLGPGSSYKWTYQHIFDTDDDHSVWAWVDKENTVAESDESNNQANIVLPVGGDCYEPDDTCGEASPIPIDGTIQERDLNPVGDVDWAYFEGISGVSYLVDAVNFGVDAEVSLEVKMACGGLPSFGGDPPFLFVAPLSGRYYVKVAHNDQSYGPQSTYRLSVTAGCACTGHHEPNNACAQSHDIPTDGSTQNHSFCCENDDDWTRFDGVAGTTYVIEALNPGPNTNVRLNLHDSCDASASAGGSARFEWVCPAGGVYYVKALNSDPESYGDTATYDLRVSESACQPDGFEPDETHDKAHDVAVDGASQTHNICPAGDVDWARFTASAGTTYSLETINPAAQADTYLCLYEADGVTRIACDDDSGSAQASRLIWQAPDSDNYLVKVHHYRPEVAGPDTRYDLVARTGECRRDAYEIDSLMTAARSIPADGTTQRHNVCPAGDADWVRFQAIGQTNYLIETSGLGPEADTVLSLFDASKAQLDVNDDYYGGGLAARISYTVPSSGEYYVKIQHYDQDAFGSGTDYQLSVIPGTPTPIPTVTPITQTITPTLPPASSIQTLILANTARMADVYGQPATDELMIKLQEVVTRTSVMGEVLRIENNASVADAYAAWQSDLLNTKKANAVAAAIRGLVMQYVESHEGVKYIVLVGGDWIIPFRRVPDRTSYYSESGYLDASDPLTTTTVGAACRDNMILTDDYYADVEPAYKGGELYVPDYAIGRLVETPDDIVAILDTFLAEDQIDYVRALVTGGDMSVQDAASEICTAVQGDLDPVAVDCTLIGPSWSGDDLREKQLDSTLPFRLQSINGHADHSSEVAPDGDRVTADEIASATSDLDRAIIYTVGCHSGLNVLEDNALDLAEAFARQRTNYVANTGFGWWASEGIIAYSERLMSLYTSELLAGPTSQIGPSLMRAKQRYVSQLFDGKDAYSGKDAYDKKILMESTLYGLPHYALTTGPAARSATAINSFPSVAITPSLPVSFGGLQKVSVEIGLPASYAAFGEENPDEGTYFTLDGYTHLVVGEPVQPAFYAAMSSPAAPLRGAVLTYGEFQDQAAFDPVIAVAVNEYSQPAEPAFAADGWYPPVPVAVHYDKLAADASSMLVTVMGQYDARTGTERLYDRMDYDLYYSIDSDQTPAVISATVGVWDPATEQAYFKVLTGDASGIHRVAVSYDRGQGTWTIVDLAYDATMAQWRGTATIPSSSRFFVHAVDGAGNVTVDDNKGALYTLGRLYGVGSEARIYLPLVERQ